jgi:ketosteroid isomerase-like protein
MKIKLYLFIGFVLFILGCQKNMDLEKQTHKLIETDIEFSKTSERLGAAEAFRLFMADSAIQLPEGELARMGREKIYDKMKKNSGYTLKWKPEKAVVARAGDMGYTWGYYVLLVQDSSGTIQRSHGKYLNVWEKQADNSWKVVIDIGNQNPEP